LKSIALTRRTSSLPVVLAIVLFAAGCREYRESEVAEIKILSGDNQCCRPGSEGKEIVCEFLGPHRPGLLGGKGSQNPVPGVEVRIEPLYGSDIQVTDCSRHTDEGGKIKFSFRTGAQMGDNYLKVIPVGFESAAKTVRVINGVIVEGAKQEAFTGHFLDEPIRIRVFNADGSAAEGVRAYFSFVSFPGSKNTAKCKAMVVTDAEGVAENQVRIGSDTGRYKMMVEFCRESNFGGVVSRGVEIPLYGKNFFGVTGVIMTVLGGLAVFIFGMASMTEGLQLVAGDQMRRILRFFTRNSFVAVLAGALVTGIIQSSSATTVMVVGFVNAGLLNLTQAIGVIFGANIGTTVTAQLISFNIGDLAYIFVVAGLLLVLLSKKTSLKGWGQTSLGFGLLFLGLEIMSDELKMVADFPSVVNVFRTFDCTPVSGSLMPLYSVFGAVFIGTLMTVIIQSSSATIGIALVLASNGLINFYTAVPLILGDNIGTTITANLAAIGANRRAKQAAFGHFLFNMIGVSYMLLLFYVPWDGAPIYLSFINALTPGDVFAPDPVNITRHIATAHTMFNVINVMVLFPFIGLMGRACAAVIRIKDDSSEKICHLEPHLLDTPAMAIEQSINSIRYMTEEAWSMASDAMSKALKNGRIEPAMADEMESREMKMNEMQANVTNYLVELTSRRLTEPQAEIVPLLIHCTNDAERIADYAGNMLALVKRLEKTESRIPDGIQQEIDYLWLIVLNQAKHVAECLRNTGKENYIMALKEEARINEIVKDIEKKNVKQMRKGKTDAILGTIILELLTVIEKIGDHLTNIAERAPDIQKEHVRLT